MKRNIYVFLVAGVLILTIPMLSQSSYIMSAAEYVVESFISLIDRGEKTVATNLNISYVREPILSNTNDQTLVQIVKFDYPYHFTITDGVATVDEINYKTGASGINLSGSGTTGIIKSTNVDMSNPNKVIYFVFHVEDASAINTISLYLSTTTNWSKFRLKEIPVANIRTGWNTIALRQSDFNQGTDNWSSPILRIQVKVISHDSAIHSVTLDEIKYGIFDTPKCVITFDDGYSSVYTEAFQYMQKQGLKGTAYVISNKVGANGFLNKKQLDEMYSHGWCIGNHTADHLDLSKLTRSHIKREIEDCTIWQLNNGYTRGVGHIAYPYASYTADVGSIFTELGMKTGRIALDIPFIMPNDQDRITSTNLSPTATIEYAKTFIDAAIASGGTAVFMLHRLTEAGNEDINCWSLQNFHELIDYIVSKGIETYTIDEWYKLYTKK